MPSYPPSLINPPPDLGFFILLAKRVTKGEAKPHLWVQQSCSAKLLSQAAQPSKTKSDIVYGINSTMSSLLVLSILT